MEEVGGIQNTKFRAKGRSRGFILSPETEGRVTFGHTGYRMNNPIVPRKSGYSNSPWAAAWRKERFKKTEKLTVAGRGR